MKKARFLNQIVEEILRERDIDSLLKIAVDRITDILGAERATFYFFSDERREIWSYVATDLEIREIRVLLGNGVVGRTALEKRIFNIKDAYKCLFFIKEIDQLTGYRTRTLLSAPLLDRDGNLLGAIQCLNKKKGHFTKDDGEILRSISFYIAISLESIRLLQEKETLFRSTLYALAGAIDAKDPVTAGHSYRVAYFSVKIARELGCSEEEVENLECAAYLHDIGKIGVPDRILCKREKLSPRDIRLMRKHPLYTHQILKNISFSPGGKTIPMIASNHHEFLDGSGYPCGLAENQISVLSRIITIADIYDALTSFDRSYKKCFTVPEALKMLRGEAKKNRLDKKIVNVFIEKELYKYERLKYERPDLQLSISYQMISQEVIFHEKLSDEKKTTANDLAILSHTRKRSLNIEQRGALFLTKQYLPVGSYLDMEVKLLSEKVKCTGKVVWTERVVRTPHYKVGVTFINMPAKKRKQLSDALVRLSKKKK